MSVETQFANLNGLTWGVLSGAQLSLEEARAAATEHGWRLPSLRDVVASFDGGAEHQFNGQLYSLHASRFWLRHDYIGKAVEPYGYQFNTWSGAVFPHPASETLSVVFVREVRP